MSDADKQIKKVILDDGEVKPDGEKLQKVLARIGLGSRRKLEESIKAGEITVNGSMAKLGDRVVAGDKIKFKGRPVANDEKLENRVMLYHKPVGEVCSRKDPEGRATVFDGLPRLKSGRWVSVGRLDYNTSGLLLLTTDGELANALMHPSSRVEREYLVRVMGRVDEAMLQRLKSGVDLDDGPARFTDIQEGGSDSEGINRFFYVVLSEGRNREVRRLWESQGVTVSRLKRVRYGEVFIPSKLKKGQWMELKPRDAEVVYTMADLTPKAIYRPTKKVAEKRERQAGKSGKHPGRRTKKVNL
ncbi:pseudouridine synthase [Luminiphilus sp.]|nr:pseudouridine synthase [Luminiphilus sp.]MDB2315889.1 pseudouridine synthase [Luminiphilus sp.]MDB2378057.1 pseudouridine synthase [Luminiphilus sp.]MDB2441448.1 pseudouridine synthase [Luminiphilus sp.]MDB3899603.1 pseudouridine synthase [Luminiphilus sp.]